MAKQDWKEAAEKLIAEAKSIAENSQRIQTEEGRTLINLMIREMEIGLYGEVRTPPHSRNHG